MSRCLFIWNGDTIIATAGTFFDARTLPEVWHDGVMIVGITGTLGAGKGTVVDYLVKQKGFKHFAVSDTFLAGEARKKGLTPDRNTRRDVANEYRAMGPTKLMEAVYDMARLAVEAGERVIIEPQHTAAEVDFIKSKGGVVIAIDADVRARYNRILQRGGAKDSLSFDDFLAQQRLEMISDDPDRNNIAAAIMKADILLRNDGTPDDLFKKLEKAFTKYENGIRADTYLNASLDDWQAAFHSLYGHIDDRRSFDSVWRHAMVNASKFSSDIRKNNFGLAFTHLAHILCWTLSFAEHCRRSKEFGQNGPFSTDLKLSDIVWEKYPGRCPYCDTNPCSCPSPGMAEAEGALLTIPAGDPRARPKTLDAWGVMFDSIYGNTHAVIPLEALAFHLVEETGEVTSQIIRITEIVNGSSPEEKKKELQREVADVFSWICSVVSKINRTYFYPAARHFEKEQNVPEGSIPVATLSKILWDEYGSFGELLCSTCRTNPCSCDRKLKL